MGKYLLDTNVCAFFLRRNHYGVDKMIKKVGLNNCYILDLTIFELMVGVETVLLKDGLDKSESLRRFVESVNVLPSLPYHNIAAKEKAYLYNIGKPNEDFIDLVIGCASVVENMVLITENVKHFENIRSINIENWINRQKAN